MFPFLKTTHVDRSMQGVDVAVSSGGVSAVTAPHLHSGLQFRPISAGCGKPGPGTDGTY